MQQSRKAETPLRWPYSISTPPSIPSLTHTLTHSKHLITYIFFCFYSPEFCLSLSLHFYSSMMAQAHSALSQVTIINQEVDYWVHFNPICFSLDFSIWIWFCSICRSLLRFIPVTAILLSGDRFWRYFSSLFLVCLFVLLF